MLKKTLVIVSGILVFFVFLEFILRAFSWFYFLGVEKNNRDNLKNQKGITILCVGESTTAGTFQNAYPKILESFLNKKGYNVRIVNKGIHKTNSTFIVEKITEYINDYKPQIVISMMGINDDGIYYQGINDRKGFLFKEIRSYQYIRNLVKIIYERLTSLEKKYDISKMYLDKANVESKRGNFVVAEGYYKKSISLNKKNILGYLFLLQLYFDLGYEEKAKILERNIQAIFGKSDLLYIFLGSEALNNGDLVMAEVNFNNAVKLNSSNFFLIGDIFYNKGELEKAENVFKKAINYDEFRVKAFVRLGEINREKHDFEQAINYYKKAFDYANGQEKKGIGNILRKLNVSIDNAIGYDFYDITGKNYLKMYEILNLNNINLIVVQYPRRSISRLRDLFVNSNNVFFVDNEKVFDDAVANDGYSKFFVDIFAGDFGHCTPEGNRLLAENIAKVILENNLIRK